MNLQQLVIFVIRASIALTVFGYGLGATSNDILYVIRRPGRLAWSLVAMFVVMPIVAVTLRVAFQFPPSVGVVLVALAISPVPPLLPRRAGGAGGRTSYGLGLMATTALLSIVVIPVEVDLLGRYLERPFAMSPVTIAGLVGMTALLPLVAGTSLRAIRAGVAQRIARTVTLVAMTVLILGIVGMVGGSFRAMWSAIGHGSVFAMAVFVTTGLVVGHVLGGPDPEDRIVLALSTACRHPGIALAIAAANFPQERFGAILLLYVIVSAIVWAPYVRWVRRRVAAT